MSNIISSGANILTSSILIAGGFIAGLLILLMLIGAISLLLFGTSARRTRAIRKQAKIDYENARGTAHLRILRRGRTRLEASIRTLESEIAGYRALIQNIQKERDEKLRMTLERQIAQNHLAEVPGIGQKLKQQLLNEIFVSRIEDFRYSSRLSGIGEARQRDLNIWVKKFEQQIPSMLAQDFPGKTEIMREHEQELSDLNGPLTERVKKETELKGTYSIVVAAIKKLEQVTLSHFKQALKQPDSENKLLEDYLTGVFAEWEPIPGWFKDL